MSQFFPRASAANGPIKLVPFKNSRFGKVFWPADYILSHSRWAILGLTGLGLTLGIVWSPHAGIACTAFINFLLCLKVERRHLDRLLIPPLVLIGFHHVLMSGIGLPMVWYGIQYRYGGGGEFNLPIFLTQLAYAVGFPMLILGYYLAGRRVPPFSLPVFSRVAPDRIYRVLALVGYLLLLYYIFWLSLGFITGGTDRNRAAEFNGHFGLWSLINIFPRFPLMYYGLLPLMYQLANKWGRLFLIIFNGMLLQYFIFSGSRGALLTPICITLIGCWTFSQVSRRAVWIIFFAGLLAIPYVPLIAFYRSSSAFMQAKQSDWQGRLGAFKQIERTSRAWDLEGSIQLMGDSFSGVNDRTIFELTPVPLPFVGWQDVDRLKLFWLPSQLAPQKKNLLDGNEIVRYYFDDPAISGAGISFDADMYRRFGWTGIVLGNFIFGLFLGWFFLWVFRLRVSQRGLWMTLILIYFFGYFTSAPYRSLLETAWIWLWELPKHMLALGFVVLLATLLTGFASRRAERRLIG